LAIDEVGGDVAQAGPASGGLARVFPGVAVERGRAWLPCSGILAAVAALAPPAAAQSLEQPDHWSGEGAVNASYTTGNTNETDFGVDLKAKHTGGLWIQSMEFSGDYGDENGVENERDLTATAHVERLFTPRWSGYLRGWWENKAFSGFGDRYFIGPGAIYRMFDGQKLKWSLEGGVGYKVDEVDATATAPARAVEEAGLRAASKFRYDFNPQVSLTNDTVTLYSSEYSLFINTVAVTANMAGGLSMRASYEVHYDLNALAGFEDVETTSKVSLVYKVK
jgi:putative salt-induced outer membrane protein